MSDSCINAGEILQWITARRVMTIATARIGHGTCDVWAAPVFFVNDGLRLFFLSAPEAQHSLHIEDQPQVAVTIYDDAADFRMIRGIQLRGVAQKLSGIGALEAAGLYRKKFPFIDKSDEPEVAAAMAKVSWYRIEPTKVLFVDNSKGLGNRSTVFDLHAPQNSPRS